MCIERLQIVFFNKVSKYITKYEYNPIKSPPAPEPAPEPAQSTRSTPTSRTVVTRGEYWRGSVPKNNALTYLDQYKQKISESETDLTGLDLKIMNMIKQRIDLDNRL